jgi:hypothetical protein
MRINSSGDVGVGTTSPKSIGNYKFVTTNATTGSGYSTQVNGTEAGNFYANTGGTVVQENRNLGLSFETNSTERMRVSSGGNVGIGITTPDALLSLGTSISNKKLFVYEDGSGAYGFGIASGEMRQFAATSNALTFGHYALGSNTFTERMRMSASGGLGVGTSTNSGAGDINATGNITAFFSDKRLKNVSGKIENALDKVNSLSGVYYTMNDVAKANGYDSDETQVGVLAQEIEAVLPEIVKAAPFDLDEHGNSKSGENYKTVQYEKLVPLLIEAIKELKAEVDALKGK